MLRFPIKSCFLWSSHETLFKFDTWIHCIILINMWLITYRYIWIFSSFWVVFSVFLVILNEWVWLYRSPCVRRRFFLFKIFCFSTSLEPLHGFASNFVWMFLWWTPTKFVKIGVLPLFFMELWVILCNFWPILKKSSSIKPLTRNHSNLVWRVPRGSSF